MVDSDEVEVYSSYDKCLCITKWDARTYTEPLYHSPMHFSEGGRFDEDLDVGLKETEIDLFVLV